jgi:hypothetical protein
MKIRRPSTRKESTVEVRQNLKLIARERGKIVTRREGHNIWLNLGSEYLAQMIAFQLMAPLTPYRDDRIRYMGVGIGGTRQLALATANSAPLFGPYPGSNAQTDDDPTVTGLERPVRISGTETAFPYSPSDVWLAQVQAPPIFPSATSVTFRRLFTETDISYGNFTLVPVSEISLHLSSCNPANYNNTAIAYDTFATIAKTQKIELEVSWTIRIG